MRAVATETICFGDTSTKSTSSGATYAMSVVEPKKLSASSIFFRSSKLAACGERRTKTRSSTKLPSAFNGVVRLGDDVVLFFVGRHVDDLVRHRCRCARGGTGSR